MATVSFTVPDEYARTMSSRTAAGFYLDVFGAVRKDDTMEKLGEWTVTYDD